MGGSGAAIVLSHGPPALQVRGAGQPHHAGANEQDGQTHPRRHPDDHGQVLLDGVIRGVLRRGRGGGGAWGES